MELRSWTHFEVINNSVCFCNSMAKNPSSLTRTLGTAVIQYAMHMNVMSLHFNVWLFEPFKSPWWISCPLNGGQVERGVDQVAGGAEEPDQVAEHGHPVVFPEGAFEGFVLGVLLPEFSVLLLLAAQPDLVPQAVLLLHRPHLEHHLRGSRTEPLPVQSRRDHSHEEQKHLQDTKRQRMNDGEDLLAVIVKTLVFTNPLTMCNIKAGQNVAIIKCNTYFIC